MNTSLEKWSENIFGLLGCELWIPVLSDVTLVGQVLDGIPKDYSAFICTCPTTKCHVPEDWNPQLKAQTTQNYSAFTFRVTQTKRTLLALLNLANEGTIIL
jgi:hypothetical protein